MMDVSRQGKNEGKWVGMYLTSEYAQLIVVMGHTEA